MIAKEEVVVAVLILYPAPSIVMLFDPITKQLPFTAVTFEVNVYVPDPTSVAHEEMFPGPDGKEPPGYTPYEVALSLKKESADRNTFVLFKVPE